MKGSLGFTSRYEKRKKKRKITHEDINEYLTNKARKIVVKSAKKLNSHTVSGYSNDSNRFGDSNLTELLVWGKKIARDVSRGVPLEEFSVRAEKRRHRERMGEIAKVKKRREERETEKARREEEMALLARQRARAELIDCEKTIDVLKKYLDMDSSDDLDIEIHDPCSVFKGLNVEELEELCADIKKHCDLYRGVQMHKQYWEALLVVCDWELAELRKREVLDRAGMRWGECVPPVEDRGLHRSVEADVISFLQGKTYVELERFRKQIELEMRCETEVVEYWEAVLRWLHIIKAKACLKEIHTQLLRRHLVRLEKPLRDKDTDEGFDSLEAEPVLEEEEVDGSTSPQLFHGDDNEEGIDPEEDWSILEKKRISVLEVQRKQEMAVLPTPGNKSLENRVLKAMGAMEEGDDVFGSSEEVDVETRMESEVYGWHNKYRPRKPKYFNRVHTGYEWNKYNRTHYDHDNPPPKIVQGYKFNIFYPDLVDKSRAPSYTIEEDGENSETCIILFHSGPPYEDIGFRIVNKDWDYSRKKGFKCTFDRGVLQLYFNFKRFAYRR